MKKSESLFRAVWPILNNALSDRILLLTLRFATLAITLGFCPTFRPNTYTITNSETLPSDNYLMSPWPQRYWLVIPVKYKNTSYPLIRKWECSISIRAWAFIIVMSNFQFFYIFFALLISIFTTSYTCTATQSHTSTSIYGWGAVSFIYISNSCTSLPSRKY